MLHITTLYLRWVWKSGTINFLDYIFVDQPLIVFAFSAMELHMLDCIWLAIYYHLHKYLYQLRYLPAYIFLLLKNLSNKQMRLN